MPVGINFDSKSVINDISIQNQNHYKQLGKKSVTSTIEKYKDVIPVLENKQNESQERIMFFKT